MSACYIAQNRMGPLLNIFYPWGIILQGLAIFHFIRRRPDTYWLWIILFGGGLGAAVYIVAEAAPYRRKRSSRGRAIVTTNPFRHGQILLIRSIAEVSRRFKWETSLLRYLIWNA